MVFILYFLIDVWSTLVQKIHTLDNINWLGYYNINQPWGNMTRLKKGHYNDKSHILHIPSNKTYKILLHKQTTNLINYLPKI